MRTLSIVIIGMLMAGTALATPPITSNLVVWLDASDAETRKGYGVHTWYDKAARPFIELHGNNGTQYEDSEYSPLWGVNMQNGLGVLTFAAKRDYLVFDTYDYMDGFGDDDYSIWVVASTNTDPGGGGDTIGLLSSGAGDLDEDGFEFRWSIERFQYSTCCPHNSDLTVDYDSPLNRGQVYILNVNRVGGNIDGSIDGRIVVSSSSPGVVNDFTGDSYIGTITPGDPGEGYLDGDIAEILIYKGAGLAGAAGNAGDPLNDVGSYLANKWGILNTAYTSGVTTSEMQTQIDNLQDQLLVCLETQIADISLTPGPQGAQGKVGPAGTDGADGAAGGAGADADCVACADVANGAVDLACLVLGENIPTNYAQTQAAATVIVNTLLISTNICETDCDIGTEIDALINAKMNP